MLNFLEKYIRIFVIFITNFLPVKVIRDDRGTPFLYRYHLFTLYKNGPGMCIHRFVKSDPERGYHDHPWNKSISFILCGGYEERIYDIKKPNGYYVKYRNRFNFNYLDGVNTFHRVIIPEGKDAWTIFAFQKRSKIWSMISLKGEKKAMSETIYDQDAGWWNTVGNGKSIHSHVKHKGYVMATVDIVIISEGKVLLIKRGKEPFKDCWAFPGGRIEQKDFDMLDAAKRELKEETGIANIDLRYVKSVGNSSRDPRGFCITNIFVGNMENMPNNIKAGDDAVDYNWFDIDKLPTLAFDHKEILHDII